MGLFSWLKTQVRNSILQGVQSALDQLAALPAGDEPVTTLRLEFRAEPPQPADEAPVRNGVGRKVKV